MEEKDYHFVVWDEAHPNTYFDAEVLNSDGVLHFHSMRPGQTAAEYIAEIEAAKVREQYGLPPGRTMPTAEEIAAGPVAQRRRVRRLTIVNRLSEAELLDAAEKALNAADAAVRWRWNLAEDGVYADDKDTIEFLKNIGADPDVILAEEK